MDVVMILLGALILGVIYGLINRVISIRKLKGKNNDFFIACWIVLVLCVIGLTVLGWQYSIGLSILFLVSTYLFGFIPNIISVARYMAKENKD